MNLAPYRKAVVAGLGFVSIVLAQAFHVSEGWVEPLLAAATAAGVFGAQNVVAVDAE